MGVFRCLSEIASESRARGKGERGKDNPVLCVNRKFMFERRGDEKKRRKKKNRSYSVLVKIIKRMFKKRELLLFFGHSL